MARELYLGPPGTGKTTTLLDDMENAIASGVSPSDILFTTFTVNGVNEAVNRAMTRFNLSRSALPWFRTLHSAAFRALGVSSDAIYTGKEFDMLKSELPYKFEKEHDIGSRLLELDTLSRNVFLPAAELAKIRAKDISPFQIEHFQKSLQAALSSASQMDYTGVLERYAASGPPLQCRIAYVDEAQDLTPLQWAVVLRMVRNAERVVFAGDDDQAIHQWAGADVPQFLSLRERVDRVHVLSQSYRIPAQVHKLADRVCHRIHDRYEKPYKSTDRIGCVTHRNLESLNRLDVSEGTWLFLARNRYFLKEFREMLERKGFFYWDLSEKDVSNKYEDIYNFARCWTTLANGKAVSREAASRMMDKCILRGAEPNSGKKLRASTADTCTMQDLVTECALTVSNLPWFDAFDRIPQATTRYIQRCLGRKDKPNSPRIRVGTIHAAKGGEADNVVLMADQSKRTFEGMHIDPDAEHRVFYVGVTRAKESLTLVLPHTRYNYAV